MLNKVVTEAANQIPPFSFKRLSSNNLILKKLHYFPLIGNISRVGKFHIKDIVQNYTHFSCNFINLNSKF